MNASELLTAEQLRLKQARAFLPAVSADDLINEPYSEPEMLIERFVEKQSLTMLDGAYGSFKTGVLLLLGLMVSLGTNFGLPFGEVKQGRVLFVGVEANRKQYARQFRKIVQGLGLRAVPNLEMTFVPELDLNNDNHFNHLYVRGREYDLLMLDTLSAACSAKLSDNDEMRRPMARLYSLATVVATVFSHHYSKPSAASTRESKFNALGANAIGKTCDAQWGVSMTDEGAITLVCEKDRGAGSFRKGEKLYLQMEYDKQSISFRSSDAPDVVSDRIVDAMLQEAGEAGVRAGELDDAIASQFLISRSAAQDRVRSTMARLRVKYGSRLSRTSDQKPWVLSPEVQEPEAA